MQNYLRRPENVYYLIEVPIMIIAIVYYPLGLGYEITEASKLFITGKTFLASFLAKRVLAQFFTFLPQESLKF